MNLRSHRERVTQTLCFELGGLALVTPLYMLIFGRGAEEGLSLVIALSIAVMLWAALFNTSFDWAELRLAHRVASDRPHYLRILHAFLLEGTSAVVTLPLIMWISDLRFGPALALDIGMTLFYACYAYFFHLVYDHFRPVHTFDDTNLL
jgi:uncharacterized membrane protein